MCGEEAGRTRGTSPAGILAPAGYRLFFRITVVCNPGSVLAPRMRREFPREVRLQPHRLVDDYEQAGQTLLDCSSDRGYSERTFEQKKSIFRLDGASHVV